MNKDMKKKMLVPTLRFPEFRDAGEWEKKKLGDLSQIVRGGSPRPIDEYITSDANGLNWLKIADVDKGSKYVTSTKERVLPSALSKTREVNPGDLIMSNSMSFGRPYILKIKSCIHDGWIAVTQIDEQTSRDYLYYLILSPKSQEYFLNNAAGSGVQNLNADIIKLLHVPIPKHPKEQQKIADCLSSIDELISAQSQKVEALKTHKKGLMQQLFPNEGETSPSLRFPEFLDAGEWEEKTLGQVAKYENGKAHEQDIAAAGEFVVVNSKFISTEGEVRKFTNSAFCIAEKNDILMVLSDIPNGRAIAKCFYVDSDNRYTVNQRICKLKPYKAVSIMLFYVLNRNAYFLAFDDGVKQTNLKKDDVLDCPILLPKDLNEQQKIADSISSIDEIIRIQSKKHETLKTHKKGLMQQLFPALEDAT